MRWNCPHCGVALAVSDEKLGSGWSFSKCYKCGGFALVRRSDVNLIKVDKAPIGENVILPESSEHPLMSQEATQHLAQHGFNMTENKPVIRQAARRAATPPEVSQQAMPQPSSPMHEPPQFLNNADPFGIPEPLPEEPVSNKRYKYLPLAIGIAATTAIASGIYLYMQGQALWQKARTTAAIDSKNSASPIIDEVRHKAMAPDRTIPARASTRSAATNDGNTSKTALIIEAKNGNVPFYAGPGVQTKVLGKANPAARYTVSEWKDQWFQVTIKHPQFKNAWVRNDQVRLVSQEIADTENQPENQEEESED